MGDSLAAAYPEIGKRLPKLAIATLPTPVTMQRLHLGPKVVDVAVKHDDLTSTLYGGNKVRKLEFLLRRAQDSTVLGDGTVGVQGLRGRCLHAGRQAAEGMQAGASRSAVVRPR